MAARYLGGYTAYQIARELSLSISCVRKVLRDQGVNAKQRQQQGRRQIEARPISNMHRKLGDQFYFHYKMERKMERKAVAAKLGWTPQKCASVERGVYDLTLTDLQDLSSFMKISIQEVCVA